MHWNKLPLWPHQLEALHSLEAYIKSSPGNSFLVHMPTGSGKTGIIATLARCILSKQVKIILILTPRIALRNQMYDEVSKTFFLEKLKLNEKDNFYKSMDRDTEVVHFTSNYSGEVKLTTKRIILISTIQKINKLHRSTEKKDKALFKYLKENTDVTVIDEGHYEPAISWSLTIRDLGAKRILFTATPYRNDFKRFDFDYNNIFSFSYNLARKANYLREVAFIKPKAERFSNKSFPNADELVKNVKYYFNLYLKDISNAKVIIRCDSKERIIQIGNALMSAFDKNEVIAFHENFGKGRQAWQKKRVPKPDQIKRMTQKFWIHQYKLMEGVDNKDFRMLVFYDNLGNDRSIIQQIGRIVRNPERLPINEAYVIDYFGGKLESTWRKFRDFDSKLKGGNQDAIYLLGSPTERLTEAIAKNFTDTEYIFNKYREKYEDITFDPKVDIKLPLRINFLQKAIDFKLSNFTKILEERFKKEDYQFKRHDLENNIILYYYRVTTNSEYLEDKYSFILKDGVSLIYNDKSLLGFLDTSGYIPIHDPATLKIEKSISRELLKKVFNKTNKSSINSVKVTNTNVSINAIDGLSYNANSLQETPPFLEDKSHVLNTISGYFVSAQKKLKNGTIKDILTRRYLGFYYGRISEGSSYVTLDNYINWAKQLMSLVSSSVQPVDLYTRFAETKESGGKTDPSYLLLNNDGIGEYFITKENKDINFTAGENVYIDPTPIKIEKKDGKFLYNLLANDHPFQAEISFKKNRYILSCDELSAGYEQTGLQEYKGIIDFFNKTQTFKVIPKEPQTIYYQNHFVNTIVKFGKKFDKNTFHVGKIIHSIAYKVSSEKGNCLPDQSTWTAESLFGLIDSYFISPSITHPLHVFLKGVDYVVCDDSNEEVADFILAWKNPLKVVMVHAKYGEGQYGSKNLEAVCRQVVTNIRYLNMFLEQDLPSLRNWDKPYKMSGVTGSLLTRIRKTDPGFDGKRTWQAIKSIINHPSTQREIWMLLGNMIDRDVLLDQLEKDVPNEFAINTVQFLHGTMQNVGSNVITLKVLCVNNP